MKPKSLFWLLTTVLLITFARADAQQPGKILRIGFLNASSASGIAVLLAAVGHETAVINKLFRWGNSRQPVFDGELADLYRRSAHYIHKILKGTKPADIPVQQATNFELIINLKAAKKIGLTIQVRVLARANRVR